jgi:hypothetical protein
MADRRPDDRPLAPPRTLSGPNAKEPEGGEQQRRPLTERVSAAISSGANAVAAAASSSGPSTTKESSALGSGSTQQQTRTTTPAAPRDTSTQARTGSGPQPRPRGTRRARLRLVHVDPWSVMKTAFLLSIAFGIVTVVAVAVVWSVLGAAGVWDSINKTVSDVMGGSSANTFQVQNYVGTSRVLGFTMIVAVIDVILITAISTLGAFLYNLAAALLGGVEVTLAEDDR